MCGVCGCSEGETRIEGDQPAHDRAHDHAPGHSHSHPHSHAHGHAHSHPHAEHGDPLRRAPEDNARLLQVEQDILGKNNAIAAHNRQHFADAGTLALNLVSSPGAGKTTLLVRTLQMLAQSVACAVIEGDQESSADADRIRETGAPAVQVNTGRGCHLDAQMVHDAFHHLTLEDGVLFIENVGNLVCPAGFDLGEAHKVVIASVTEGEDKPLKYPNMFAASSLMLVSKTDLLPHLDFDVDALIANARRVNPGIAVIRVCARSGEGMDRWLAWLRAAHAMSAATR